MTFLKMPLNLDPTDDNEKEKQQFLFTNQQVFNELLTFIDFAEGLTLGFIEINFKPEINYLIDGLKNHKNCKNVQFVVLDYPNPEIRFLRDEILKDLNSINLDPNKKTIILITGLANSIGIAKETYPVLSNLNFIRDAYKTSVPYPLVFILPDYAITNFIKLAPDFWAWKSGVFRFQTIQATREFALERTIHDQSPLSSFHEYEKQEKIDLLHRLLMEYQPSGQCIQSENIITCLQIYQQLASAYLNVHKLDKAKFYADESLKLARQSENLLLEAQSLLILGNVYIYLRDFQQSRLLYQQALSTYIKIGDRYHEAQTYHNLGAVAQELREWQQAKSYYQTALEIFVEYSDRYSQAKTYHQLGRVAQQLREWQQAKDYYQTALEIDVEYGDRYSQAQTYHNLGSVAQQLREWEQAKDYYQTALEIFVEYSDRYSQAKTYHNLGMVAQQLWEWEQAKQCYHTALEIYIEYGARYHQAFTYHQLGSVAKETGDLAEAKANYLQALQIWAEFEDTYNIQTFSLPALGNLYRQTQDESILEAIAGVVEVSVEELRGMMANQE